MDRIDLELMYARPLTGVQKSRNAKVDFLESEASKGTT